LAAEVRAGRARAEDHVAATLRRIEAHNPAINAFTAVFEGQALADARALDARIAAGGVAGPLAGVAFAVKNLFDIAGVTTLAGSKIRREAAAAKADAVLVRRLKAADAILIGALNMDEFAYGFVTENAHYGPTRNPHDLTRIAGGSSGGSAAAVAAGLVDLTLGSDTNGSIRVPAGLCGVYGLKPTLGRLSTDGVFPFVESLDHAGAFARRLDDLALAFEVLQGEDAVDGHAPEAASAVWDGPLRAAVLGGWFVEGAFDEVREGLGRVARALDAAPAELPGAEVARSAAFCLTAFEGARLHHADLAARPQDFDPAVRGRLLAGARLPAGVERDARRYREMFRREAAALFEDFDILLAPATPCPAPRIGEATMMVNGEPVSVRRNIGAYTQPLSFIGVPVLTVPLNRPGAAPIGIQLIAPPWREARLFEAARRLEAAGVVAVTQPAGFD
jgi:aspartyl-tRNA(Asn)/glutamyl-tRNA(Gln) amidotransferase subunit A